MRKTKELVDEKSSTLESKRKKLLRSQTKEKICALELKQTYNDLKQLTKVGRICFLPLLVLNK